MADIPFKVKILNQQYPIRSGHDTDYIESLAAYVDAKMRQISDGTQTVDTVKVAVLAALNIADDLFQAREELKRIDEIVAKKSQTCVAILDQFVQS